MMIRRPPLMSHDEEVAAAEFVRLLGLETAPLGAKHLKAIAVRFHSLPHADRTVQEAVRIRLALAVGALESISREETEITSSLNTEYLGRIESVVRKLRSFNCPKRRGGQS